MSASFFTSRKDSVLAAGSANFATKISATPTAYGLVAGQATAYAALNTTFQTAYTTAITPSTRTKATVAAKNSARVPLRKMASDLAKIIDGTPTVTDQQKIDLGLNVRKTPSNPGSPGTPSDFEVELTALGYLNTKWKCTNPTGGTMYQVFRKIGTAEPTYLGGTGSKKFVDSTLPAGTADVTYMIQAVRSSGVGAWTDFNVKIGVSGSSTTVAEVPHTENVKIAA
jgi:hypothetical protein